MAEHESDARLDVARGGQDEPNSGFFRETYKKAVFTRDNFMRGWDITYRQFFKLEAWIEKELKETSGYLWNFKNDDTTWEVKEFIERLEADDGFDFLQSRTPPRAWRDQSMLGIFPYVAHSIKIRDAGRRDTEYTPKRRKITSHSQMMSPQPKTAKPSQSKLPTATFVVRLVVGSDIQEARINMSAILLEGRPAMRSAQTFNYFAMSVQQLVDAVSAEFETVDLVGSHILTWNDDGVKRGLVVDKDLCEAVRKVHDSKNEIPLIASPRPAQDDLVMNVSASNSPS